jgi:hypothetical protein
MAAEKDPQSKIPKTPILGREQRIQRLMNFTNFSRGEAKMHILMKDDEWPKTGDFIELSDNQLEKYPLLKKVFGSETIDPEKRLEELIRLTGWRRAKAERALAFADGKTTGDIVFDPIVDTEHQEK